MSKAIANAYGYNPSPQRIPKNINKNSILDSAKRKAQIDVSSFIFCDLKALYELGLPSYMDLTYKELDIVGYELYLVEQWVSQRHLSTTITSFTGNTQDVIRAVQVILPTDYNLWPGQFKQYHQELDSFSQPKQMPDGSLMFITNLSTIPSSLNILHVETGDIRSVWLNFMINFNLKMLHCAGRSSLLLSYPAKSSVEKFLQLYKFQTKNKDTQSNTTTTTTTTTNTAAKEVAEQILANQPDNYQYNTAPTRGVTIQNNEAIAITHESYQIVYMVDLIHIALHYFNIYTGHIDGLICKGTTLAIERWWLQYGKPYLGIERPKNEPMLGPTTVAGMLSLVLSCYFKLILEDCINTTKDPFDKDDFINAVKTFQKKYSLIGGNVVSGKLDITTVEELFQVTSKYSNHDIIKFKKLLKSRVHDLTGKGNPITLSHVILTTELDSLISNIHGGTLGLLWKGKGKSRILLMLDNVMYNFYHYKFSKGNPNEQLRIQTDLKKKRLEDEIQRKLKRKEQKKKKQNSSHKEFNINDFVEARELPADLDEANDMESTTSSSVSSGTNHTVSSMFCNYDKSKYSNNLDLNKLHFDEYNRRNSIPRINDLIHEDLFEDLNGIISNYRKRYRSASFSEVSDIVARWTLPFDASVVKMARNLRKIETKLAIKQRIDAMQESKFAPHSDDFDDPEAEKKFISIKKQLQINHDKYASQSVKFERNASVLENKQRLLYTEINEINSLTSKLKYDVRLLEFRMRDVEDSIKQFDTKLANVKRTLVERNSDVATALKCVSDETQFDCCLEKMMNNKDTCYKGICLKVIDAALFAELKKNITGWINYLFSSFTPHSGDYNNIHAKDTATEFPI